ncbi:MAG: aldo/keto reductase [Pseudomonadota bacterium]
MQTRRFGRTNLDLSLLTFGCGAVGGLMTKGEPSDQDRAVAWARDNGINHFDTAPLYGNGASEENLGRALGKDRDGIIISTKVRLAPTDRGNLNNAIRASIEASLKRLKQDSVDLFQIHNTLGSVAEGEVFTTDEVFDEVVPALEKLKQEGKTRFVGFTANGETDAIHALLNSGHFDGAQIFYNILNPTAGEEMPETYPAQNYRGALRVGTEHGVGSIGVRVLAGGALTGTEFRHPLGMQDVAPIGSGRDYATDAERACRFQSLVDDGHAENLVDLAIRYVISNPLLTTTEIGIASLEEVQAATAAINRGGLSDNALTELENIRSSFAGEAR